MKNKPSLLRSARWQESLIVLVGLVVRALVWSQRFRFPFDDSFITFRYAQHLAEGKGIVWNLGGVATEGYTNFLYVVLLVPSFWLKIDPLMWSWTINIVALIASAILIYRLIALILKQEFGAVQSYLPLVMALAFIATPLVWMNALSAMETTVFGFLLLASAYRFTRSLFDPLDSRSFVVAFILAFLAALTRPEGALLGVVLTAALLLTKPRRWKDSLAFLLPLLAYHIWRFVYFGTLLPNSFLIKVLNQDSTTLMHGKAYITFFLISTLGLVLASLPVARTILKKKSITILAVFCALILGFYAFPSPVMGLYDRFLYSVEVFLFVLAGVGLWMLAHNRAKVIQAALVILFLCVHAYSSLHAPRAKEAFASSDIDYRAYVRIASILRQLPSHDSISFAFADAGIIPLYSQTAHIDLVGLNDNDLARAHTFPEVSRILALRSPDLILVPIERPRPEDDSCRHIFRSGHGIIGSHYPELLQDARFSDYRPLIAFHAWNYDVAVLERLHSAHAREIEAGFMSHLSKDSDLLIRAPNCLE